jgi:AraC-like DNA-binding protein
MEECDLFSAVGPYRMLSHWVRPDMVESMQRREYQCGELILPEFGWVDHVGFLAAGRVEICMGIGTNTQTAIYSLYPGDFYGDLECLTDRISMASVVCREVSVIYLQNYESFMLTLESHPVLKSYFLKTALHKFRHYYQILRNGHDPRPVSGVSAMHIPKSVQKAVEYIEKNYHRKITVTQVSQAAGLSKSTFLRRFKQSLGVPFKTFLNRVRISKAKHLISSEGLNVTEACYAVGFNDSAYFSRTFRKVEGTSPSHYKSALK